MWGLARRWMSSTPRLADPRPANPPSSSTHTKPHPRVEELRHNVQDKELVLAIACNKADLPNRVVSRQRAEAFASSINAIIIDTSAKDNFGVNELFQKVTETVIDRKGSELIRTAAAASRRGPPPLAGGRQGLSRAAQNAGFNDGSSPLRSIPPPKSNGCC